MRHAFAPARRSGTGGPVRTSTFLVVLAVAVLGALGAVAANLVVGGRLFERTVVDNPYQAGLRYDADQKGASRPDCAISAGPCERTVAGSDARITLEITPRPVRGMADLDFLVRARRGALPAGETEGEIAITMPGMYMGENRVPLAALGDGSFRGKGLIVRCPSGRRVWSAEVTLRQRPPATAAPLSAIFTFELGE